MPAATRHVLVVALPLAAMHLGCARNAEERQLDEMRNEIDRIQVDRDRADREALPEGTEATARPAPSSGPSASSSAIPSAAPSAAAEPPPEPEDGDTDDPTPRPTIRLSGAPGRGGRSLEVDDGAGAAASALDPEAKRAYDTAFALVTAKHCDRALDAFAAFLVKWPDHPYADNAMFWRGECYFEAGDYAHAAEQLEGTLARFPAGNKAPDALLKLGMAEAKLGNDQKAKESFDRLLQLYPQSDAARRVPQSHMQRPQDPR